MFSALVHFAQTTLVPLGPLGVFLGSIISEIVGPFPSISMILGASFSLVEHLNFSFWLVFKIFLWIAIPEALGATLGSFVIYSIGYFGGKPAILKWGKYARVKWESIEKFHDKMQSTSRDEWFLFFVRAVPLFPNIITNIACGLVRVSFWRYTIVTFLGMIVRGFIYGIAGWSLGRTYKTYSRFFVRYERDILIVAIISAVVFLVWFLIQKSKKNKI